MRAEIEFFRKQLQPNSSIKWEMPIAHLIPWIPFATTIGDSSLKGAGGFSIRLGFWWHIRYPEEIIKKTLLYQATPSLSINVLEYVTVIINYIAAMHVLVTNTAITNDPYPVLLNITDNSSALSWTLHTCKRSKIGRLLGRFFCSLLINSPLGINSQWISTEDNKIPDDISGLKRQQSNTNSPPTFDYTILKQTYQELNHCSFFLIEPRLISMIWDIVLTENWPNHEEVQILKQKPLGRLIT